MRVIVSLLRPAFLTAAIWVVASPASWAQDAASTVPPPPPQAAEAVEGAQILARGPIHEAYAQPQQEGSVNVLVVPKQPPDPIEEVPPAVKPEDETAIWIPGYWAWDDDQRDFLWVSGVWRIPPPGERWVEGYWTPAENGYRWVPGFWTATATEEVAYYPEPPQSLEQGPASPSPGANYSWVSGCWVWENRYVWRPGYWAQGYPNWVWMPPCYYWCPRGWVFCDGYWDFPLARRGLLFSPVYFERAVWRRPGFRYVPTGVVDPALLTIQLFARPDYGHYYFGDYYASAYLRQGIVPWYAVRDYRFYRYDPLFTYYQWHYGQRNPRWNENVRGWYQYYRDNESLRPPHTLAAQQQLLRREPNRVDIKNMLTVQTIQQVRQRSDLTVRLSAVPESQVRQLQEHVRDLRRFAQDRRTLEAQVRPGTTQPKPVPDTVVQTPGTKPETVVQRPERLKLPRLPETGLQAARREPPTVIRGQAPTGEEPATLVAPPRPPSIPEKSFEPRTPPRPKMSGRELPMIPPGAGAGLASPDTAAPPMPPSLRQSPEVTGGVRQTERPGTPPVIRGQKPAAGSESGLKTPPGIERPKPPLPPPEIHREAPRPKQEIHREPPRPPAMEPAKTDRAKPKEKGKEKGENASEGAVHRP